jgi:signal transduction histidine kinase
MTVAHSTQRNAALGNGTSEIVRLCHDLRQYIAAGLLLSSTPDEDHLDAELHQRLEMIHQQFVNAAALIASASDPCPPSPGQLDLSPLVKECVQLVELTRSVSMKVEVSNHCMAYGDPVSFRRALVNVLDNAARAVGQAGIVTVSVVDDDTMAWVEVTDDGHGFGQIEAEGGHGLSIVSAAVRASHGRLEISSGPGPGTRVRMALPTRLAG